MLIIYPRVCVHKLEYITYIYTLHVRVTSMVNVEDPDFDMCVEKKYLVRNSQGEVRPLKW